MDYVKILDKTDAYIKSIVNSKEFGLMLEMKKKIEEQLNEAILSFKGAQEKYKEALQYGKYHPDLKEYQQKYSVEKAKLYSNEMVKRYLEIQNNIQRNIDDFITDLTSSISNKFKRMQSIGL